MDQEREWATRVAVGIGERVAHYRKTQEMSAQQLADRCAALGMRSVSRTVVTKLENGRREAVSTAELVVLAKALDVPPVLLLFPIGLAPVVEVLPGVEAFPLEAAAWFGGDIGDPADVTSPPPMGADSPEVLLREHEAYAKLLPGMERSAAQAGTEAEKAGAGDERERLIGQQRDRLHSLRTTIRALLGIRETMQKRRMVVPELGSAAARVLDEYATNPGAFRGAEADDGSR